MINKHLYRPKIMSDMFSRNMVEFRGKTPNQKQKEVDQIISKVGTMKKRHNLSSTDLEVIREYLNDEIDYDTFITHFDTQVNK